MTKKNLSIVGLILALLGLSLYLNWDRFGSEPLAIGHRSLPPRGWTVRLAKNSPSQPVIFMFNQKLKLTSVKVVELTAYESNKYVLPLWRLTTSSNSVPTKEFVYGAGIPGMHPDVKGASAEPLQPGLTYRLFIEAGDIKAEHDFKPVPKTN